MNFDIDMTKEEYLEYVKPLVDKAIEIAKAKDFSLNEEILFKRFLKRIVKNETNPEALLKVLEEMTPLQESFAKERGLHELIEKAKNYLSSK